MDNIGSDFKFARTTSNVSLEEASEDTSIPLIALEQIEEGNIGSFKDIFELKNYLMTYAKYLGLNATQVIDEFNEYMFEYTSKIPLDTIAKAMETKQKEERIIEEETKEIKVVSPYLRPKNNSKALKMVITVIIIIILIAITMVWAIKQVMIG